MSETMETLLNRRSVRKYKDDPIPEELLEKVLEAGKFAPTGMGKQAPIILAVTKKEMVARLSAMNAAVMGSKADPFYGAPAVLIVLANKAVGTYLYDGSLVLGNLMNAAWDLGLGTCWIHRAKEMFASEEGKAILAELGVDGEYEGIGNCIIGYADEAPVAKPRKENYVYYIK